MTNVSITPAAELDLLETMGRYESIRPGLSKDFLLAFDAAVSLSCAVCGRFCLETMSFPQKLPRIRSGNSENRV